MKTWVALYLLIWVVFLQMLAVFFPVLGSQVSLGLHWVTGVVVVLLAYYAFVKVRSSQCPARVKLITKTTAYTAVANGFVGVVLSLPGAILSGSPQGFVLFIHFSLAVAIITQASSSATAYDMWEEKEFQAAGPAP